MSKVDRRYPLEAAKVWAREAIDAVGPYSPMLAVAGSIRRQRDDIGDVDLVVLDYTSQNPWQKHEIGLALAKLGYVQTKNGDKIASFTHPSRCPLDLYYATPETWGITLLVRTGSAAHNVFLADHGAHRLPSRRLKVSRGIVNTADIVVASRTEEECFAALGLRYVEPWEREAPELEAYVRGDDEA